jgi:L-ascorbate metabolism protein UlaG (beta-lactamase superfamily)
MRISHWTALLAATAVALAGCSGATATPTVAPTLVPTPTPAPATVTVAYEGNCQMELMSSTGQRIMIDVYDPTLLTSPAKDTDILLTTHTHSDHYLESFEQSFPGQKITNKTTELNVGDIKIKSIAASHSDVAIDPVDPSNHIFVIEFAGFKIVHGGSTGQLQLTPEQLTAIGSDVDIAAMVLVSTGGLDPKDEKAMDLIKQVNPKLLIPTHASLDTITAAGKAMPATFSANKTVTIPRSELTGPMSMLMLGSMAKSYGYILKAPESKW